MDKLPERKWTHAVVCRSPYDDEGTEFTSTCLFENDTLARNYALDMAKKYKDVYVCLITHTTEVMIVPME